MIEQPGRAKKRMNLSLHKGLSAPILVRRIKACLLPAST